jgi:hypothetical protein
MPMCVDLRKEEWDIPTSNKELNELLKEVRIKTGENFQLVEAPRHSFWKKERTYNLLLEVGGYPPFQSINFYRENSDTSINDWVPADLIAAYLYGVLN